MYTSVSCFGIAFLRLNPCRRTLLETRQIENEYNAAKRHYNQALEISQAVLGTWGRVEFMQTQENCSLLEQELGMISKKVNKLINQTFRRTLPDCGTSLEGMGVGHGTRGASSGERGVSNILAGPQTLNKWADHTIWRCPVGEWRYQW